MVLSAHLIVIGGFAGAGKSTLARRIGREFAIPVFEKDQIARNLQNSEDFRATGLTSYGVTFDFFFAFAEAHLQNGGSLIFDQNMGRERTWRKINELQSKLSDQINVKIFILDSPWELCLSRFAARTEHPDSDHITLGDLQSHKFKWDYLNDNELPQAIRIDGTGSPDEIFKQVMKYLV